MRMVPHVLRRTMGRNVGGELGELGDQAEKGMGVERTDTSPLSWAPWQVITTLESCVCLSEYLQVITRASDGQIS